MPSIISHPAVPLAIGFGLGRGIVTRPLLAAGVLCSIIPDLDVYLQLYSTSIGHRGVTHSIAFALACGALACAFSRRLGTRGFTAFCFVALATASHGVLDAFTNGGPPVVFFWPFSSEGAFMPWRVIEVSPIGISRFFSARAVTVLTSELQWVWLPAASLGTALFFLRRLYVSRAPFAIRSRE
jgi:inner membrane protein